MHIDKKNVWIRNLLKILKNHKKKLKWRVGKETVLRKPFIRICQTIIKDFGFCQKMGTKWTHCSNIQSFIEKWIEAMGKINNVNSKGSVVRKGTKLY